MQLNHKTEIMKTLRHILFLIGALLAIFIASSDLAAQTCPPPPPSGAGAAGGGSGGGGAECGEDNEDDNDGDQDQSDEDSDDTDWDVNVVRASDPNDITGPDGFDTLRWVARNETMPYLIRFENSPVFATASAVRVEVICPIDEKHDILQFRLGSYGFNGMLFEVPPNTAIYSTQLNLLDEQGIYVDITAGVNIVTREAFWIFQSIDPLTGLPSTDVDKGFLPVKDTTFTFENDTLGVGIPGDGFANFIIKPSQSSQTRDTVAAFASIVFDIEEEILTNVEVHTIDAFAPTSSIAALPETSQVENLQLIVNVEDDPEGSGVLDFDLYVSENDDPYVLFASSLTENVVQFNGQPGSNYRFYTRARDNVLNLEAKNTADVETTISTEPCPLDCNGDPCGTAFFDLCGQCVGGNTGTEACVEDCNGDLNGTAYLDNCGICVEGNTNLLPCDSDCFGVAGGPAVIDGCGICRLPDDPDFNSTCADCEGTPNGGAFSDNCGTCVGGNTGLEPCTADCAGIFGGSSILDECGVCRLPDDPDFNTTCLDCDGVANGNNVPGATCVLDGLEGIIDVNCACNLIDLNAACRYYLSDYGNIGGSNIYEIFFDPNADRAVLIPILQVPFRVSLAYNREDETLYLVNVNTPAVQLVDVSTLSPVPGPILQAPAGLTLGQLSGSAWHAGKLYVASKVPSRVSEIDLVNFTISNYSPALVTEGDIAFGTDGTLKMASSGPKKLFDVMPGAPNVVLNNLPDSASGLMIAPDGNLLLLLQNKPALRLGDENGQDLNVRYKLYKDGVLFTPRNGDLASGCAETIGLASKSNNAKPASGLNASRLAHHPNPTSDWSNVEFVIQNTLRSQLELIDLNGRVVKTLFAGETEAGQLYKVQVDTGDLPNGVYFLKLSNADEILSSRLMVVH